MAIRANIHEAKTHSGGWPMHPSWGAGRVGRSATAATRSSSPRRHCEIAIKRRQGRLGGVDEYLARHAELHAAWGFATVVIEPADAVAAGALAVPYDDPFDRMLVVQSRRLGAPIVTCDDAIRRHIPGCLW
jgi:PIN domain nuclease of toxin-antitoxin system